MTSFAAASPTWSEYEARCPISPDGSAASFNPTSQRLGEVSPTSQNSDKDHPSPVLSPGDWNVASPQNNHTNMSPQSSPASWQSFDSSVGGSPLSAPAAMPSNSSSVSSETACSKWSNRSNSRPLPNLPSQLGNNVKENQRRMPPQTSNGEYITKTSLDREREMNAIRNANRLMTATQGPPRIPETKKLMDNTRKPVGRVVIVPTGREHLATSTWKNRKYDADKTEMTAKANDAEFEEYVDDFKSEIDRERELWAQRQALKLMKGAGNFL